MEYGWELLGEEQHVFRQVGTGKRMLKRARDLEKYP